MTDINFQPVFDYIDQKVVELKEDLASKEGVRNLQVSLDAYAKQSKDYYQEVTVLIAKVNRMEEWIRHASVKLELEYKV
jgi:hypothetical protein